MTPGQRDAFLRRAKRDARIVRDRGKGYTFARLAAKYGITNVRCRQICKAYAIEHPPGGVPLHWRRICMVVAGQRIPMATYLREQ